MTEKSFQDLWVLSVYAIYELEFAMVEFHFVFCFPILKFVEVFLKLDTISFVVNSAADTSVVGKKADNCSVGNVLCDVVDINEEKEWFRTVPCGIPRRTGRGDDSVPSTMTVWL